MKTIFSFIFVLTFFCTVAISSSIAQSTQAKVLRHVVLFKFKDTATPDDIKKVEDAFRGLPGQITLIKDFEWGINNSPENLNQGLTHCFFVTFSSEKDRNEYLVHPMHKAFVEVLKPYFDKATVVDYWAAK